MNTKKSSRNLNDSMSKFLASMFPQLNRAMGELERAAALLAPFLVSLEKWLNEQPTNYKEALIKLAKLGWFLDLGMPMDMVSQIVDLATGDPKKARAMAIRHLRDRVPEIEQELYQTFPSRAPILRDAFEAHCKCKFSLSVPVFLTQADGIFDERWSQQLFSKNQRDIASTQAAQSYDPDGFLATLLAPLSEQAPLWMSARDRADWMRTHSEPDFGFLNRHLVLHGVSLDYGNEERSLVEAISLLSYLRCIDEL